VYCPQYCNANIQSNTVSNNKEIGSREVISLFYAHKFDELEEMAERLRRGKSRFHDGSWQLQFFYEAIGSHWRICDDFETASGTKFINEWIEKYPDSATPWIMRAQAYVNLAWKTRSGNYGREVTAQQWKGFRDSLVKAGEALSQAENLKPKDPHVYALYVTTAMGLNGPDIVSNHLFKMGVSIEPEYLPVYYARAIDLLPRWGGKPGALAAFATEAVSRLEPAKSDEIYASIAQYILFYTSLRETQEYDFSYDKIKRGSAELLKKYPNATGYLNGYCAFACLSKDKKLAQDLFNQIGEDWDQACWNTVTAFNLNRTWAFEK
jgi:hypothetical protein